MLLTLTVEGILLIILFIIFKTVKSKLIAIKYSIMWIAAVLIMAIVALVPNILKTIASIIGFELVSNMLFLMGFLILFMIAFALTVIVSVQKNEITVLVQELGLLKSQIRNNEKEI